MKRIGVDYRARQRRIAANRWHARLRNRPAKRQRIAKGTASAKPFEIFAPKNLSLMALSDHHELARFLRTLRKESTRQSRITINFKQTELTHSCGTLLVVSEIDRISRVVGQKCDIGCTYPRVEKVEKVFQQVGLLRLLNKEQRLQITEDDRDVFHWKYATGVEVAPIQADPILKAIKAQIPKSFRKIVVGVEEAMDNSVHHAYIETRKDRLSGHPEADARRWWIFAEVLDDWLHVNFCDLGVGIPGSLPRRWEEEAGDLVRLTISRGKKDMRMIRRAFEVGRTRTEQDHRGKGLKNIATAARDLGGLLTVHSNAGCVRFDYRDNKELVTEKSHKRSILGTVVQWSIPLSA